MYMRVKSPYVAGAWLSSENPWFPAPAQPDRGTRPLEGADEADEADEAEVAWDPSSHTEKGSTQ